MQRSDITGRVIVPAASRVAWQINERRVLLLLFQMWDLTERQIMNIFHALFPNRIAYLEAKLRDQHNQRWRGGRKERDWRTLDRPNEFDATPYTNQEYIEFANAVADIDGEAANLNIPLVLKVQPTHEYLTHVPAGTAGLPAGALPHPQAQAAAPAPAASSVATASSAQTQAQAPALAQASDQEAADEHSDHDSDSSDDQSASDVVAIDEEYQHEDATNDTDESEFDALDNDADYDSDHSASNNAPQATNADAHDSEEELLLREQAAAQPRYRSVSTSPRNATAAVMASNTPPYPWDQEEHYIGPPPADWPEVDVPFQRIRSTRWPVGIPQPLLGAASASHNSANIEEPEATIVDDDDDYDYDDLFHREPDVRPPGPDPGSSFQEAERRAAQALNLPQPASALTTPTMAPRPIANGNPDLRYLDDLHGLRMLHHKDIKFCDLGAHLIKPNEPVPVNPASQLYRLGGPLHLVSKHINSGTMEIMGKEIIMVCNTTWCGVCRSTDWAQAVQDPADPMTLLPEDSCMSHSDTILQDMLRQMRGRPIVHRGDMGRGDLSNIFCARIGAGARVTPYSTAVSKKVWTDERIVIITPEDVSAVSVMRCGEGCDKC